MSTESQWVTFTVKNETFGFEIEYVKEMLRLPEVHVVPNAGTDNLGVILLRSEVIPVFELRKKFGHPDRMVEAEELVDLLKARQADHEAWLSELERCIHEKEEFTLTVDPHQCKFGKWYDHYTTEDVAFSRTLKHFNEPHKRIHAVGAEAVELMKQNQHAEAEKVLSAGYIVLHQLIQLFNEAALQVRENARASLIVVGSACCTLGVAVDSISAVVRCEDQDIQSPDSIPGIEQFGGLIGLLPEKGSDRFIMLLDPAQLYPQLIGQSREQITV
ncbi:MAG: chemotaxis protein CheW [Calditrichota bacterium]